MKHQRTTVTAAADDLRPLQAEADRRAVPLNTILREAVEDKARALRSSRQPRVGVARSTDGQRAADVTAEPIAADPR
jgi:hypothetical protein